MLTVSFQLCSLPAVGSLEQERGYEAPLFYGYKLEVTKIVLMAREENFTKLLSALESIHPFSVALSKALEEAAKDRTMHKKGTLLSEGGIQHSLWFIAQGFAREYRYDPSSGDEHTNWFWQSGDFVFHNRILNEERSHVSIDFYAGSVLIELDLISLAENSEVVNECNQIMTTLTDFNSMLRNEHLNDLVRLTRMLHVKKFYEGHQMLFNFVRHKDLASFLGIRDKSIYRYLKGL